VVRLATAVSTQVLAPVGEALSDGSLSTHKAQVIERAVDALPGDSDLRARGVQVLLAEAKRLDATELRKVARRLPTVVDPAGDERRDERALDRLERAAHLSRHLSITEDQSGGAWIKGLVRGRFTSTGNPPSVSSHPQPIARTRRRPTGDGTVKILDPPCRRYHPCHRFGADTTAPV
jgi:hypothetical protein